MTKHINIKITGKVQGIGFRFSTYEKFVELGLVGKAENVRDGSVLVDTEGPEEKLQMLIEWCGRGPMGAKITGVEVTEVAGPFVAVKNG